MRISDWSSDVCSSDLIARRRPRAVVDPRHLVDLDQDDAGVGIVARVQDFELVGTGGKGFGQAIHRAFQAGFPCQAREFCTTISPWLSHYLNAKLRQNPSTQIGSEACRERVCTY